MNAIIENLINQKEPFDFIAIDFETATYQLSSACAIGIAAVCGNQVVDSLYTLIHPPGNQYDRRNIAIHGITPQDTKDAPTLSEVWEIIAPLFYLSPVVLAHNAQFDMSVLYKSVTAEIRAEIPDFCYIDTLQMVKNIIPGRRNLAACVAHFQLPDFHHHNARADAIACAEIALACLCQNNAPNLSAFCRQSPHVAIKQFSNLMPTEIFSKSIPSFSASYSAPIYQTPVNLREILPICDQFDCAHPLFQKNIVFTGELSIQRRDAMQKAVDKGAVLRSGVSRKTDFLVVGIQDIRLVGSSGKSTKEEKAHQLNTLGEAAIQVLNEQEFFDLL